MFDNGSYGTTLTVVTDVAGNKTENAAEVQ
jgi:hypothetical protein